MLSLYFCAPFERYMTMSLINSLIVASIPLIPKFIVRRFAAPYIAGITIDEAIATVKKINTSGAMATIDLLGEFIEHQSRATQDVEELKVLIKAIHQHGVNSNVSIKPTQMGLLLDPEFCYQNIRELVTLAKETGNFIRIDMEDSPCTQLEIDLYLRLRKEFDNVGLVIQAYLHRTDADIDLLISHQANLRICKGIYVEPASVAIKDKQAIRDNFLKQVEKMFINNCYVGVATHDEYLVNETIKLVEKHQVKREDFEFQMLLGVLPKMRESLIKKGYRLRIYVPYGNQWYGYSTRRFKENPEIAGYVAKALFGLK